MARGRTAVLGPASSWESRRKVGGSEGFWRGLREVCSPPHGIAYLSLLVFCMAAFSYQFSAQIPMVVAAAAILVGAALQNRGFRVGGATGVLLLVYFAFVALSVPLSIWLGRSIYTAQEYGKLLVIYLVAVNVFSTPRRVTWMFVLLLVLTAVFPARGSIVYYVNGWLKEPGRANWYGLFGNSNMLALTMLMHLPFVAVLVGLRRSKPWKLLWIGVGVLFVATAVLTKSRAGFLALGLLSLGSLVWSRRRFLAAAAIIVGAVSITVLAPADFRERMGTIFASSSERDQSATSRLIIWRTAVEVALSRPLTGIGIGTYTMANAELAPEELGTSGGERWEDTHNTPLNIWAEIGTPGVFVFLFALAHLIQRSLSAMRTADRDDPLRRLLAAGIVAMVVFFVMSVFNTFHRTWFVYVHIAAMLGIVEQLRRKNRPPIVSANSARMRYRRAVNPPFVIAVPRGSTNAHAIHDDRHGVPSPGAVDGVPQRDRADDEAT